MQSDSKVNACLMCVYMHSITRGLSGVDTCYTHRTRIPHLTVSTLTRIKLAELNWNGQITYMYYYTCTCIPMHVCTMAQKAVHAQIIFSLDAPLSLYMYFSLVIFP